MLIDDNPHDNFFHERAIKAYDESDIVIAKESGTAALEYLNAGTDPRSDLIFLDINMPGMNAWEFLEKYVLLDQTIKGQPIIIMLTTSGNPFDLAKAKEWDCISDFITKPLTKEKMKEIADKYFL